VHTCVPELCDNVAAVDVQMLDFEVHPDGRCVNMVEWFAHERLKDGTLAHT
jgi:hypothetical protein